MEETLRQKQAECQSPSQKMSCESEEEKSEEWKPPQSKKRLTDASSLPGESEPLLQAWSQDPLFTCSQYSEGEFNPASQEHAAAKNFSNSEPSFLNSLQTQMDFENLVDDEGRTSTQKCFKHHHSSQMEDEKENSWLPSSNSPIKRSYFSHSGPLSNHKWTEPKIASPRKHTSQLWKKAAKEESRDSQIKWTKLSSSPLKKQAAQSRSREVDEDSLAMLFTQDSEGFRVMAHRGLQSRSPLKDQSNVSTGIVRTSAYKSLVEEEEEDEILFTQDSQGNVIQFI
uniref:Uncharacterized protein n=1 Tax=Acanthochromis polyacanthus TaxID=80966 RepID=A0A3Q1GXB2_9TELE